MSASLKKASAAATKSASRGLFVPAPLAFSSASHPRVSAAGGGGDQIWVQLLIAMPQYPMAHWGSICVTWVKPFTASRYQKECSSATARSNGFCAAASHEIGKVTCPILSLPIAGWPAAGHADAPSISVMIAIPPIFMIALLGSRM